MDLVQARIRAALKLNEELAEYFRERAHAEDVYAKTLAKLSKRHFISDKSALGNLLPVWEMLYNELTEVSTIHAVMSFKIAEEVERPLRTSIQQDSDYGQIKSMDITFQKIAKDYDERQMKVVKHKKNAEKATTKQKQGESEAKLGEANKVLEQTKMEWYSRGPEYLLKHQAVDERRLQNVKKAIETFETLQNDQLLKRLELAGSVLNCASSFSVEDEIASFCGAHPNTVPKATADSVSEYRARSTRSFESVTPETLPSSISDPNIHQEQPSSRKQEKERKFLSSFMSIRRKPKNENGYISADHAIPEDQELHTNGTSSFVDNNSSFFIAGMSSDIQERDAVTNGKSHSNDDLSPIATSPTSLSAPSLRKAPSFNGSLSNVFSQQPKVDAEGYSIPPPDRTAWPDISSSSLQEAEDAGSDAGSIFGSQRIKVDIKNETVKEEDANAAVALTRVASMLKEKHTSTIGKRPRGRRERSTQLLDSVLEQTQTDNRISLMPISENLSLTQPSGYNDMPTVSEQVSPFNDDDFTVSVVSPSPPAASFTAPGLPRIKVQVTETIHALMKTGEIVRSAVWGEVSLRYTGPSESATPVCFQLKHSEGLDRVVPNAEYITPLEGYTDVYQLNTHMFHLAGESAVACISYQVKGDHAVPLVVKPMWKCEEEQTRLLVKYKKDPAVVSTFPIVQSMYFLTSVNGDVQSVQSIPAGQWMVDQQRMLWPMGDFSGTEEQVLKARFVTKQQGSPQSVAVRFEVKDQLISSIGIDTGIDNRVLWATVQETQKMIRAGKYIAEA
ncbi:hypothetical protein EC973_005133 [Apophysomyces ossiformis]|uniref:MHD domain-containing protein n=1 Tax=Apophysomyces ossiformis TaxID=679940 RepID=A0A8H7ELE4_9FUNG|nr:hypothetical protein EC973_005133 [Apophysomyces ossiformis]